MRIAGTVVLLASAVAFAAEKEDRIVPVTRPSEDTAISAARQGFDSSKSARDPVLQPKGDVPRFGVPEMPQGTSGAGWSPPKAATPDKKSANWLADAMEKQAAERKSSTGRDRFDHERDERMLAGSDPARERDAAGIRGEDSAGARESERKVPVTAVVNPLTRYLGDWMTPQDYSLLKPGLAQTGAFNGGREAGPLPATGTPMPAVATSTMPSLDAVGAARSTALANNAAAKPRENPFLEAFKPAPPPSSATTPSFGPLAVTPSAPKMPEPPPVSAAVNAPAKPVPDFVKPTQDEKYFKQLKRF